MQHSTKGLTAKTVVTVSKTGAAYKGSASSAQNNNASWATVQAHFAANKVVTFGALQQLLKQQHNHQNFVGYAVRRGWLTPKA